MNELMEDSRGWEWPL